MAKAVLDQNTFRKNITFSMFFFLTESDLVSGFCIALMKVAE